MRTRRLPGLVLVALVLSPATAAAIWPFASRRPAPPAANASAVSSIPAPEVAQQAEEASKVLRDLDTLLTPGPGVVAIQERLHDITKRITVQTEQTDHLLTDRPSGAALDSLTNQWQTIRAELATYVTVLGERATALERALQRLAGLRETWAQARADARASRAPVPVLERIEGILTAIDQARPRLQTERGAMLVLQDRVAQHVVRCDEALTRLAIARSDLAKRLLVRDGVALWNTEELSAAASELPGRLRDGVTGAVAEARQFAVDNMVRMLATLVLFATLALLTSRARREASRPESALDGDAPVLAALQHPVAAAVLLTVLANSFAPPRVRVVQAVGGVLVLASTLMVVRVGMPARRRPLLYGVGALVLVDLVRALASTVPFLEQQIFILEILGVLGVLAWRRPLTTPESDRGSRLAILSVLLAIAGSGAAAAAGYMRLALFVGAGLLASIYVAMVLYAGLKVVDGLLVVALRSRPLSDLRMVDNHGPLLERRLRGVLRWLTVGGWVVLALQHFGLWPATLALASAVLTAEIQRGALSISLGAVAVFIVTVVATFLLSAIVRFVLEEELYPRLAPHRTLPYAVSTLVHYTLVVTGFVLGLAALGIDLTKITILAGALGVGIGFGLQNLVNNFVSGLVVLYERRINVGDAVQIGDVGGRVQQLGLRACTVRTWEGAEVIVPNASLASEKVANWTLSDAHRRIDLPVGVAYGTSPEKVADILLAVARKHSHVLAVPAPVVLFKGFGDSALLFEMRVWTDRFDEWPQTHSELTIGAYSALREAAIEIPFPQREVRVRPA
jgi:potassium-dependent mechanosensitive channel